MKKIICLVLTVLLALSAFGCNGNKQRIVDVENGEIVIEYGQTCYLPQPEDTNDYTVEVTDSKGENVRLQFGSFRPSVGVYTAKYTAGKKTQNVTIKCVDTIAPTIAFSTYESAVAVGAKVTVPRFEATDLSTCTTSVKVTHSDGSEVQLDAESGWTTKAGAYTITVTATDPYGNEAVATRMITARESYEDASLDENVLFDFDDDGYLNLVYGPDGYEGFGVAIVKNGYPSIANEKSDNGVLHLSSDVTYGDVFARFTRYGAGSAFVAGSAGSIKIKLAVDRPTDYVKVTTADGTKIAATLNMLEANRWYDLVIDPLNFGYDMPFNNFMFYTRSDNGINVWIDEISYDNLWIDTDKASGVLADFDEQEYLTRVRQNFYNGTNYKSAGASYSIKTYGSVTGLEVSVSSPYAGLTYVFDEPLVLDEIESVTLRIAGTSNINYIWFGGLNAAYTSGGGYESFAQWMEKDHWMYVIWSEELGDGMTINTVTAPKSFLEKSATEGKITGFWFGAYGADSKFFIDSITVN